ncbi:hypothetical protein OMP38_32270 [Cohnella ginsengisoli]|uniref:Uncharacterized protein n=1 Tax=Cohnella ginsengisoli TaxID=425004 RepID=A0A9X4KSY1_9BACL|nr:hypothetical protein [Cohnella ginsengisoli]
MIKKVRADARCRHHENNNIEGIDAFGRASIHRPDSVHECREEKCVSQQSANQRKFVIPDHRAANLAIQIFELGKQIK